MELRSKIHSYIEGHKDEIINILKELMKIPSISFDECKKVLNYIEKLYSDNGFETEIYENEGYLLSCYGKGDRTLGIFSHGDVVSAGENWTLTQPFEPKEVDGYLIGRGGKDDKAAVLISLYCAKMLKELSIPFNSKLIMFTGIKEETGMQDIKDYLKSHKAPDFSIVPDNEFPIYRGNKGKIVFKAVKKAPLKEVKSFVGGEHGSNVAKATAKLAYCDELFSYLKEKESGRLSVNLESGDIALTAKGISKHSAFPEGSVNAASIIAESLKDCKLLCDETRKTLKFIYGITSDYYGAYLNINKDETDFDKLTIVNDEIEADENEVILSFNIRHGVKINQYETIKKLKSAFASFGFIVDISDMAAAHIVRKDHPMLLAMKNVYEEYTGEEVKEMGINPSGTYARFLPDAAEIGLSLNDKNPPFSLPVGHGEIHQPDEYLNIEGFFKAIELTMLMLLKCDGTEI